MAVICMIGMYVDYAVWKKGYMEEDCMEDISLEKFDGDPKHLGL